LGVPPKRSGSRFATIASCAAGQRFTFTKNAAGQVTGVEADTEGTKRVATRIQ
jgi:hypothetical protein